MMKMHRIFLLTVVFSIVLAGSSFAAPIELLNVSYDPTRELYREFNEAFAKYWQDKTGQSVIVRQSHGGSGSQARAVIDGLQADVVTLALAGDVDAIAGRGLLAADWQQGLPRNSSPYTSTLALLVRKGNPKNIRSWEDLVRDDVQVITPNPKTSGVARWNYLAIWGYVLRRELGEQYAERLKNPSDPAVVQAQSRAREFIIKVYKNVPVLDRAARGATNTFGQRRIGDVLINWENEILLSRNELDSAGVEIVIPEISILAEPTVAVVDKNVDRRKTREIAQAYLEFLYTPTGQAIAGKNYYRPTDPEIAAKYRNQFPAIELFTIDAVFGGWPEATRVHFADGGEFDRIYIPR